MAINLNKKNIFTLLAIILVLNFSSILLAKSVERIVATVNGDVITLKQVEKRANGLIKANRLTGAQAQQLKDKVLDALIEQELVSQEGRKKGVFVSDRELEAAIEEMKKANNITQKQLEQALIYQGTDYKSFREDIKFEILKNKVLGIVVISRIVITDNEVLSYLRGEGPKIESSFGVPNFSKLNTDAPSDNSNLGVRMIILNVTSKNKASSKEKISKIREEIISGKVDFATAAKNYSQGPGKDSGGRTGVLVKELQPELRDVLMNTTPGEVTKIIDAGNALLIAEALAMGTEMPSSNKDRTVFTEEEKNKARAQLEDMKRRQRYYDWLQDIKSKATIKKNL